MSPRKNNVLTVEGWPDPKLGKLYKGRVVRSEAKGKPKCLHVTIENLDSSQLGRIHDLSLPLPIRPGNRTCSFLTACGIDASTVGTKVCLDDIAGVIIGMRFGTVAQDGSQQIDFERIEDTPQNQTNTPESESGGEQLTNSTLQGDAEAEREY
jgi:hypothetical protein